MKITSPNSTAIKSALSDHSNAPFLRWSIAKCGASIAIDLAWQAVATDVSQDGFAPL